MSAGRCWVLLRRRLGRMGRRGEGRVGWRFRFALSFRVFLPFGIWDLRDGTWNMGWILVQSYISRFSHTKCVKFIIILIMIINAKKLLFMHLTIRFPLPSQAKSEVQLNFSSSESFSFVSFSILQLLLGALLYSPPKTWRYRYRTRMGYSLEGQDWIGIVVPCIVLQVLELIHLLIWLLKTFDSGWAYVATKKNKQGSNVMP